MKLVRVSDCCGVRLCSIEFNYVRLLDRSITERSIAFDWQNFFASSIKFDYRTQSSDWVRLATPGLLVAWLLLWEGNKRVFFSSFFFVEREISAQLPQSVRKEHVGLGPDAW